MSGGVILSAMFASRVTRAWFRHGIAPRVLVKLRICGKDSSEALAKPSSDFAKIAVGPCPQLPRVPRFDMFEMSVLRVDQKAGGHSEGCALGLVGKAAEAERATDSNRAVENTCGEFQRSGELTGTPTEDDARFRFRRKGRIRKPVPDHLKNLLGTMPDNVCDRGA